jgi:hypothetical protein
MPTTAEVLDTLAGGASTAAPAGADVPR